MGFTIIALFIGVPVLFFVFVVVEVMRKSKEVKQLQVALDIANERHDNLVAALKKAAATNDPLSVAREIRKLAEGIT